MFRINGNITTELMPVISSSDLEKVVIDSAKNIEVKT